MEGTRPITVKYTRSSGSGVLKRAYPNDAGVDLPCSERTIILPFETATIYTGIHVALPNDVWGLIIGRSSARKQGMYIHHGVIDPGFRGEMLVFVMNSNITARTIMKGKRLAQLIVVPRPNVTWEEVDELPEGERGERGFGSTG